MNDLPPDAATAAPATTVEPPITLGDAIDRMVKEGKLSEKDASLIRTEKDIPSPIPAPAKKIANILEFQEIIDEKFTTVITYQSKRVEMEGRRLKPFETQQLVDMMAAVIPPSVKGRTPQEDRYDYDNKEYRAKKEEARLTARAIGIYTGFAAVSAARPNLTKPEQIREFVQGMLTDAILETLWQTVQDGGVRKAEYTSFT